MNSSIAKKGYQIFPVYDVTRKEKKRRDHFYWPLIEPIITVNPFQYVTLIRLLICPLSKNLNFFCPSPLIVLLKPLISKAKEVKDVIKLLHRIKESIQIGLYRRVSIKTPDPTLKRAKYISINRFAALGPSPLWLKRIWVKKFTCSSTEEWGSIYS